MDTIGSLMLSNITTMWGILLYWVPFAFCAFGYTVRTLGDISDDVKSREAAELNTNLVYHPSVRIGTLIGRGIVTCLPVSNLYASLFDVGPKIFGNFFRFLGRVFDQPLVPKRKAKQAA